MFDIIDVVWTLVIVGSMLTIAIKLRSEMKNSV
jgi:hypothetical protein